MTPTDKPGTAMLTESEIVEIGARGLFGERWNDLAPIAQANIRRGMQAALAALRAAGLVLEQDWRFDMENAPRDGTWLQAITEYEFDGAEAGTEPCTARWVGGDYPWQIGGTGENALKEGALIAWRRVSLPQPPPRPLTREARDG